MPPDADETLHPDDLVGARLRTSLRGFDQLEVRALLNRAADRVRQLEGMVERLRGELDDAETRTAAVADLDEDALTEALGAETARVLRSAKEAAVEIRGTAEAKAAEILRDAEARSQSLMAEAQGLYERERARATEAAQAILDKAKIAGRKELEKGRAEGRRLVAEAKGLRTRMLEDLAERRRDAASQLERMTEARARLLETYAVVEETLSRATGALAHDHHVEVPAASLGMELPVDLAAELAELESLAATEPVATGPGPAPEAADVPQGSRRGAASPVEETEDAPEAKGGDARRPHLRIDDLAADPLAGPATSVAAEPRRAAEPSGEDDHADRQDADEAGDGKGREGRRTSALRVLRQPRAEARPEPEPAAPSGFTVVDEPAVDEGVRVIAAAGDDHDEHEPSDGDEEAEADQASDENAPEVEEADVEEPDVEEPDVEEPDVEELFDRIKAQREEPAAEPAPAAPEPATAEEPDVAPEPAPSGDEDAPEEDAPIFTERDAAVEAALPAVVRAFKRTLGDEQNELLAAVSDARGVPRSDGVLPSSDDQRRAYAEPITRPMEAVARAGAAAVGRGEPDVGALAQSVAASLCDPLRERVAAVIDESGPEADDLQVAERISAVYRQWRRQRLDRIADEALRAAFALGVQSAAAAAELELEWTLDPRDSTCSPDCEDNALAGPVAAGQRFPAGGLHPPAHAECRCLALPATSPQE